MTEFFELFQPSLAFWRKQRELDKVLVVQNDQGGTGPRPLDLDSGVVDLVIPESRRRSDASGGADAGPRPDDGSDPQPPST